MDFGLFVFVLVIFLFFGFVVKVLYYLRNVPLKWVLGIFAFLCLLPVILQNDNQSLLFWPELALLAAWYTVRANGKLASKMGRFVVLLFVCALLYYAVLLCVTFIVFSGGRQGLEVPYEDIRAIAISCFLPYALSIGCFRWAVAGTETVVARASKPWQGYLRLSCYVAAVVGGGGLFFTA